MRFRNLILSQTHEQAYYRFMLKYEIYSLQITCLVGAIHTLFFLVLDFWRAQHYGYVVIIRLTIIVLLLTVAYLSTRIKSSKSLTVYSALAAFSTVSLSMLMDFTAGLPAFFLPNFICLLLYVFNAGLGYSLRMKIIHSLLHVTLFITYALWLSPHPGFHISQVWNLFVNASISLLIGFLIERYKRLNFVQREELLAARKEIEEMSVLKTKLISVMSHDLGTPLNGLRGLLQLKDENMVTVQEFDAHWARVRKSIDTISFMLQNLVKWSRTQIGGVNPSLESLNIKQIITEAIESVSDLAQAKRITITNQVQSTLHLYLDKEVLKLVARNFLTNGIKFSPADSALLVSSRVEDGRCTISFRDYGKGIKHQELGKVFSLQKRVDVGTENESGSGIGLWITKDFVEKMGGSVSVKSEEGKGSTFSVTFLEGKMPGGKASAS
jgi:signal transduction histidine kinase